MRELDRFQRAALLLVLIGVSLITVFSGMFQPPMRPIGELDVSDTGATVRVNASIEQVYQRDSVTFMRLTEDSGEITGVAFEDIAVEEGNQYLLTGRVKMYEGTLELIVEDVQ